MDKKTVGIVSTLVSVVLCGCPGLCLCLFGGLTAAGIMPYTGQIGNQYYSGNVPASWGYAALCLALLLIAIPVVVGFLTLRKKPGNAVGMNSGPLPPAI
jgi:TRAP-type C4-dicarboxylate transport system permease small subunit